MSADQGLEDVLSRWEPVIGLEVHAQLKTETKIFCACPTEFGAKPNRHACPVCHGHPGALPVLNKAAVEMAIMTGQGLHCTVNPYSVFARKSYFYPDLPKGYQISQFDQPICSDGWLEIKVDGETRRAGIERVHMEEDAGKTIHDSSAGVSRVDFNRTGVPLVEIVGHPDLHSPEEAMAFLKELRTVLRYLGVCDGNLEEGSFRCDANVSIRPLGESKFGTRVEVKNLNSFRNVGRAISFEIRRQARALEQGETVAMETRLFDADRGLTNAMRSKEDSSDYRYFPDPDLLPLELDPAWIKSISRSLPELPEQTRARFSNAYTLRTYDVDVLTDDRALAQLFEDVVATGSEPKGASNWIQTEVLGRLANNNLELSDLPVTAKDLGRLLVLRQEGTITGKMAKNIFKKMWDEGADPDEEVKKVGAVIGDEESLKKVCALIMERHPEQVDQYRAGKTKVLGFLMGQIMRETKGTADPGLASTVMRKLLDTPSL